MNPIQFSEHGAELDVAECHCPWKLYDH
jgi:hypothetical protein